MQPRQALTTEQHGQPCCHTQGTSPPGVPGGVQGLNERLSCNFLSRILYQFVLVIIGPARGQAVDDLSWKAVSLFHVFCLYDEQAERAVLAWV